MDTDGIRPLRLSRFLQVRLLVLLLLSLAVGGIWFAATRRSRLEVTYPRIREGMSRQEVEKILGRPDMTEKDLMGNDHPTWWDSWWDSWWHMWWDRDRHEVSLIIDQSTSQVGYKRIDKYKPKASRTWQRIYDWLRSKL
jgi:hypothetical protein